MDEFLQRRVLELLRDDARRRNMERARRDPRAGSAAMTPFERAFGIVTEYEAAGETSAARMLLFTRIEALCEVAEAGRRLVEELTAAWPLIAQMVAEDQGRARDGAA